MAVALGADPGFDAHGPKLVAHDADLRDLLYVQRPGAMRAGDFFVSAIAEFADAPMVQAVRGDNGVLRETPVVDDLAALQLSLGGAFHERLRLDVLAPVYATTLGPDGRQGPAMGDVRLASMVLLLPPEQLGRRGGGLGVGVVGFLDLPSGDTERFLGRGGAAGGGKLAATWELRRLTFSGDVGMEATPVPGIANLTGGPALLAGGGIGVLAGRSAGVNLEVVSRSPLEPSAIEGTGLAAESALSVRGRWASGTMVTLGGAVGLTEGAGVAAFRGFFAVGFGHHEAPKVPDLDIEGTLGVLDGCPLEAEVVNGWKDDDGCPDELGALALDVRFQGRSWPASVELEGPEGTRTVEVGAEGLLLDSVPGSLWKADATAPCLSGHGEVVAQEGGSKLLVPLEPVLDAVVAVTVRGPDRNPLPAATSIWRSDVAPHCVPEGVVRITGGLSLQQVGAGAHTVSVTADGYSAEEVQVAVATGQRAEVDVTLSSARVRLEAKRIVISEKVFFETGNARIKRESFALLDEVASTIVTAPGIGRVEIGGHTDNQGADAFNLRLSQQRAQSVRDYLAAKGVPREQLVPVGYGESRPIDTNRTEAGREANRRVEFNLLDQPGSTP